MRTAARHCSAVAASTSALDLGRGLGFGVLGFRVRVWGLGLRFGVLGFRVRVWGLGLRFGVLGFKVRGLGCRV